MSKSNIILLQETQLNVGDKTLGNYYFSSQVSTLNNNADIISGAFDMGQPNYNNLNPGVQTSMPTIDMESSVVSMNSNPTLNTNDIVNNDVTNQIFGFNQNVVSSLKDNSEENKDVNSGISVPYNEPVMINNDNAEKNNFSEENYVKHFNSLRDKLTSFYNEMNVEIDKIQEQLIQKSGINLVENNNITDNAQTQDNQNNYINSPYSVNVGNNIFNTPQSQISNVDETVIIPRSTMDNAIAEMQSGMSKVA